MEAGGFLGVTRRNFDDGPSESGRIVVAASGVLKNVKSQQRNTSMDVPMLAPRLVAG